MSLRDLVDTMFEHKVGSEDEQGQVQIDLKDIHQVSYRLKQVRQQAAALKKEDEKLKKAILAHELSKAGYSNADIEIKGGEDLDLEHAPMIEALKKLGLYEKALEDPKLSAKKIKELAVTFPALGTTLHYDKTRKVYMTGE